MKYFLLLLIPFIASNTVAQSFISEGKAFSCQKFEENLYLKTAINDKESVNHYLDSLRNCGGESAKSLLSIARYQYKQDDLKESIATLKQVLLITADTNDLGEAYYYLGLNHMYLYKYHESVEYMHKSISFGFREHWNYSNIAWMYSEKGEHLKSAEYNRKALAIKSNHALAINNLAYSYEKLGMEDSALKYYLKANVITDGEVALYHSNLTRTYSRYEQYDKSLELARKGIEKFPNSKLILYDLGNALNKNGIYQEALKYARKLALMNPNSAGEYFNIAHMYDGAGMVDTATYYYKKSLELNERYSKSHHNVSIIYSRFGKFEKAHFHVDKAIELEYIGNHIQTKSIIYLRQGDFENYHRLSKERIEKFGEGNLGMGYSLLMLQKYEEAIPWLVNQLKDSPKDDRAINNMGRCYAKLGDSKTAFSMFSIALEINPENSYIYHNRASLYADLGKYGKACKDLTIAMEKEYNWTIDSILLTMKEKHCPEVNTEFKTLIHAYKGNAKELSNRKFIELTDKDFTIEDIEVDTTKQVFILPKKANQNSYQSSFHIYPNPSSGVFTIRNNIGNDDSYHIKVFDMDAKLMYHKLVNSNKHRVNLEEVSTGTYIVIISNVEGNVLSSQKIAIQ